jgi:excisionase family DNA binding protein
MKTRKAGVTAVTSVDGKRPESAATGAANEQLAYRVSRAAKLLDVSRTTLYNAINNRDVRAIKIGRSLRIPLSELKRLLGDVGDVEDV